MKNVKLYFILLGMIVLIGINFIGSVSAVSEIVINEDKSEYGGYFLSNIKIEGDILRISVRDLGGCQSGSFDLIWDGKYVNSGIGLAIVNEKEDPTLWVNLHLDLNEYHDICMALILKDFEFDLKKLRVEGERFIGINFFVSSKGDKIPDYSLVYNYGEEQIPDEPADCPTDLKICQDGTGIRREPPNCEFPACPSECDSIGLRNDGKYCSFDRVLLEQKAPEEQCDNNFECNSNVCVNDKCVSGSLIQKIIDWFRRLFGFD